MRTLPLPEAIAIIQAGQQRCWFQEQANVLAALPESAMPVRRRLRDIYTAEDIDNAQVGVKAFELDCGSKYPKAVAKITTWSAGSYRPGRFAELRSCAGWDALCETFIGQEQSLRPIVESQADTTSCGGEPVIIFARSALSACSPPAQTDSSYNQ